MSSDNKTRLGTDHPHPTQEQRGLAGKPKKLPINNFQKITKSLILNLVGDFKNPWENNTKKEVEAISSFNWFPATDSWDAICGHNTILTNRISQFLGIIASQQQKSIHRINLWSHGNFGLIAFSGEIKIEQGNVSVFLDTEQALDLRIKSNDPIISKQGQETESFGIIARQLRNRFIDNAEIYFYLCNSGSDRELLQVIADVFQVTVRGFPQEIWVCPDYSINRGNININRGFTSFDKCKNKKRGFLHLDQFAHTANPRPEKLK